MPSPTTNRSTGIGTRYSPDGASAGSGAAFGRCTLGRFALRAFGHLGDTGRGDLRDEVVALLQHGDAVGNGEVAHVDLSADLERADVVLDRRREVGGLGLDGEGVHELLENAAAHRAFGLAHEVDGNLGLDRLVGADAHEVDVDHVALDRVALELTGDGELLGAVDARG